MESAEAHHRTLIARYVADVERRKQREHLLMLKYGTVFLRKVFPHGTSWSASRHHELRLLRAAFATLKRSWWTERILWRLEIRARCHRRLRLARRAFNTWVGYVRARAVDRHFRNKAYSYVLHRLRDNCHKMKQIRHEANQLTLVYTVLTQRVSALTLICGLVEERIDVVVFTLWTRRLLVRCFVIWKNFTGLQRTSRMRLLDASDVRAQRHALHAWRRVVVQRRPARRRLTAKARQRQETMAAECFRSWVLRWQEAVARRALATQLQAELASRQLRRWLERWLGIVRMRHAERRADACAECALARRCLAALRSNVDAVAAQRADQRMAILRRFWDTWTDHVAACWRERNAGKIRRADQRLRQSDLRKTFTGLQRHAALRRRKRALANVAERHFALRWFGVWYEQWQRRQCIARLEKQADAFRQFASLREALARWQQRYAARARRKDLLGRATELVDKLIAVRCWKAWHLRTEQQVTERQHCEQASRHSERRLTLASWSTWTNRVAERRRRDKLLAAVLARNVARMTRCVWNAWVDMRRCRLEARLKVKHHTRAIDLRIAREALQTWALMASALRRERQRMVEVAAWHDRVVLRRVFLRVKANTAHRRQRRLARRWLGELQCLVQQALLRRCFHQWEQNYEKAARVRGRHQRALLSSVMTHWVAVHRERRALSDRKEKLKENGDRSALSRWFGAWTSRLQQRSAHRLLESRATQHWRCRLLRDCLRAWLRNASAQRREREVMRKRAWLRTALRRREERDQWALERMLMAARREFYLARKYVTRWTRRLAKKRGLPVFPPLGVDAHERPTRNIAEEFYLSGRPRRPIYRPPPRDVCRLKDTTSRRRLQPRIPGFMQRGPANGNVVPMATGLAYQGLAELACSVQGWKVVDRGAGDARREVCVGLLPPSYFIS